MAEAPHHGGVPMWVWVVGGGGVAVLAAVMFLGRGSSSPSTNAPSQAAAGGTTDTSGGASTSGTSTNTDGSVPMIPTLDANGAVQTGSWPTGWNTAAPAPTVPTSQQNNGSGGFSIASNQAVLSGMSNTGAPVWWVPYTYASSPSTG